MPRTLELLNKHLRVPATSTRGFEGIIWNIWPQYTGVLEHP